MVSSEQGWGWYDVPTKGKTNVRQLGTFSIVKSFHFLLLKYENSIKYSLFFPVIIRNYICLENLGFLGKPKKFVFGKYKKCFLCVKKKFF